MPRELRPLVATILLLVVAAMALEIVNGRFWLSDFRVYWSAANALLNHTPVYGIPFGEDTGYFKYAPVVAMAFTPFALLPYSVAAGVHFLLIGVALILAFARLERLLMRHMFGTYPPRMLLRGVLALICVAVLLSRETHLGNINLWLVVGALIATEALLENNDAIAGLLFGLLWLTKPYLTFMAVPLATALRWKTLRNAGISMAIGILLPMPFLGPDRWSGLHRAWLEAMAGHSSYLTSPDTLLALAGRWSGLSVRELDPRIPIVIAGMCFAAFCCWQSRREGGNEHSLMLQVWMAFALVPQLVITDQEHFLYGLPLIVFVISYLFNYLNIGILVLFVFAMFLYATRSSDLWGPVMEDRWVSAGALGLGNLLLLTCALVASRQLDRRLASR